MRIHLFFLALALLFSSGMAAEIRPDQINNSQAFSSITMDEGANITLDGGFIKNFQSDGAFNILAYGATPNDFTDDAPSIQDCYDAARDAYEATGKRQVVEWPPGEFNGNSSQGVVPSTIIELRPGVDTQGSGMGVTTFRAADNYRNTTRGVYHFWTEDFIDGMNFRDMTLEFGNNTVEEGEVNYTVGVGAYWCRDVLIENVEFRNTSGFWDIYIGGHPNHREDCKNAIVRNIKTYNAKGSSIADDETYDHTSVRINMDNALFSDSILTCEDVPTNAAALEFHGNGTVAHNIMVINYTAFGNFGVDTAAESYWQDISNCHMSVQDGIRVWSAEGGNVINFTAHDNYIDLLGANVTDPRAGLTTIGAGTFGNVSFSDNCVVSVNPLTVGSVTAGAYVHDIDNFIYTDNEVTDCNYGVYVYHTEHIENYHIDRNIINKFGRLGVNNEYRAALCIDIQPTVDDEGSLTMIGNSIVGIGTEASKYGIRLNGPNLTYTIVRDNDISDIDGTDITTITPSSYITDEIVLIDHTTYDKPAHGLGWNIEAKDGSTWRYLSNGSVFRMAGGDWKQIAWTYV